MITITRPIRKHPRPSESQLIHLGAWKGNSQKFAKKNSSGIHQSSLGYWWGGSLPSLSSSSCSLLELLGLCPWPTLCSHLYSLECLEVKFCELRFEGVLRSCLTVARALLPI